MSLIGLGIGTGALKAWALDKVWKLLRRQHEDVITFYIHRQIMQNVIPDQGFVVELYLTIKWVLFKGTPTVDRLVPFLQHELKREWLQGIARRSTDRIQMAGMSDPGAPPDRGALLPAESDDPEYDEPGDLAQLTDDELFGVAVEPTPEPTPEPTLEVASFEDMTRDELRAMAKGLGLTGLGKATKVQLIRAIEGAPLE